MMTHVAILAFGIPRRPHHIARMVHELSASAKRQIVNCIADQRMPRKSLDRSLSERVRVSATGWLPPSQ